MAKNLAAFKLRDDFNGRQVRCLLVDDYGHLIKVKDEATIKEHLSNLDTIYIEKI